MSTNSCIRAACVQINSTADVVANLLKLEGFFEQAQAAGAELVVLPENFAQMPGSSKERHVEQWRADRAGDDAPVQQFIWRAAKHYQLTIVAGSLAVSAHHHKKALARCFVVDPQGQLIGQYDKIHLFDVDTGVGDERIRYSESDDFEPGALNQVTQGLVGAMTNLSRDDVEIKLGLSICYDVRFPEWYRQLQSAGAQLLSVPAAFTFETGKVHWEVLLRARAIENQCFVLAAGQCGTHPQASSPKKPRQTWGHSMIIDPWGRILASLEHAEGLLIADLDLISRDSIIARFPAVNHRRV